MPWIRLIYKNIIAKLFALLVLLIPAISFAINTPLIVGVTPTQPFTINHDDNFSGISIDIWQKIAAQNHWTYRYVVMSDNYTANLRALNEGKIDVFIDPVSITNARLRVVDFTRPFFINSIGVIIPKQAYFFGIAHVFLRRALISLGLIFLVSFLLYINLLWYFERGKISDLPHSYTEAMSKAIWLHLLRKGLSMPTTNYGRLTALIWLLLTGLVFTSYTASITSALTIALSSQKQITTVNELQNLSVASVANQNPALVAASEGISLQLTSDLEQAMKLLQERKVNAVLTDYISGKYYLKQQNLLAKYTITPVDLANDVSAFAVSFHSSLRYPLDLGITALQDSGEVQTICKRYLAKEDLSRCNL